MAQVQGVGQVRRRPVPLPAVARARRRAFMVRRCLLLWAPCLLVGLVLLFRPDGGLTINSLDVVAAVFLAVGALGFLSEPVRP